MQPFNNSPINLGISAEPQVSDPLLYQELLSIHNGLQNLLQGLQNYMDRERAVAVSTAGTTTLTSSQNVLLVNPSAPSSVVLPDPTDIIGLRYTIKHIAALHTVTITSPAGDIDGAGSKILAAGEVTRLVSDGSDWFSI